MMEEKQEVFIPPQVLKFPPSSHSWLWFNPEHMRGAGNCEITPYFFSLSLTLVSTLNLLCSITSMKSLKLRMGDKELSQQGHLVAALQQLALNRPCYCM